MYNLFGSQFNNPMTMMGMNGCGFGGMSGMYGMYGMGGCCDPFSDKAVGYAVTTGLIGIIGGILNGSFGSTSSIHSNYDGRATSTKTTEDKIDEIDAKIEKLELKKKHPEKEIDSSFDADIKTAASDLSAARKERDSLDTKMSTLEGEIATLEKDNSDGSKTAQINRKKALLEEHKAKYDELNSGKKDDPKSIAGKEKALEEAENAKNKEIEEIKNDIQTEIDDLEEQRDKLKKQQENANNDAKMDAGDGSGVSRLFSPNKRKVNEFIKAKKAFENNKTLENYNALKTAVNNLPNSSSKDSTNEAIKLAHEYFNKQTKPES